MGPYVETSESATPTLLVLPQEPNLVRTTLCGVDPSSYGLTAIPRVQPGEPVAGNPLGGFCEGGRAQERCSRPVPTHHWVIWNLRYDNGQISFNPATFNGAILVCVRSIITNGLK